MCLVEGLVKFLVFAFNFLFVLVGIGLITLGVLYKFDFNDIHKAIPESYDNLELAPTLTIVVGSIIIVIAFFGCCGVLRSSICLLNTYALILLTIFLLQIGLAVFAFIEVNDVNDLQKEVNSTIQTIFNNYENEQKQQVTTKNNANTELVDFLQQELKCCGVKGPSYWSNSIPPSCCDDKNCSKNKPYEEGCQMATFHFIQKSAQIIGIVLLVLAATLVIGSIVALCLANSIRNKARRHMYD